LVAQVGWDILVNRKSIKKDIEALKTDFAAAKYEQAGKDIGNALALVLFGKVSAEAGDESTKDEAEYNAYVILAGYAAIHKASDDDL